MIELRSPYHPTLINSRRIHILRTLQPRFMASETRQDQPGLKPLTIPQSSCALNLTDVLPPLLVDGVRLDGPLWLTSPANSRHAGARSHRLFLTGCRHLYYPVAVHRRMPHRRVAPVTDTKMTRIDGRSTDGRTKPVE